MIRTIILLSSDEKNTPPSQKRLSDVTTEVVLLPFIGVFLFICKIIHYLQHRLIPALNALHLLNHIT